MALENLTIARVCLHEVYPRADDGSVVQPTYSANLLALNPIAMAAFRSRVLAAFKSAGHCMEMSIRDFGPGHAVTLGADIIGTADPDFIARSRAFADGLATAQASRRIPGGLVVVFDGTVGQPATPFFAIMKAELHDGFMKTGNLQATFVNSLFLSPGTKLYKIGIFISDGAQPRPALPAGWRPIVYDSQMTASRREAAATYFHSTFLGLDIPDDNAQRVRQFFERSKEFIRTAPVDQETKVDLYNGLYTYLKVDQSPTIQVQQFAATYLPDGLGQNYLDFMQQAHFPLGAIAKDLSEVAGSLRLRRLRFANRLTLSGPPEAFDQVEFETVPRDGGPPWTRITIRGPMESQD